MKPGPVGRLAAWFGLSMLLMGTAAAAERPNLVFVLVDDLRYDALGCTGHPFVKTPNIDRIAREGAAFRNAFVAIPLCSPSRASFLTGRYPHAHGVLDNTNHNALSHRLDTFPMRLRDAGYETAFIGKWHMGNDETPRPGFDRWVSFKGQGVYHDPPLNVDGKPVQATGYVTDVLNSYAADFVRQPRNKPFLLYLSHKAIHGPFTPAERHRGLYATDKVEPSPAAGDTLEGKPMLRRGREQQKQAAAKKKADGTAKKQVARKKAAPAPARPEENGLIRNQLRCLQSIDEGVGLLFQALEAAGSLDDTLFVFTSDNGYFWGEHGLGDKRAAYEEAIRIPLLMRYPGPIKAGLEITSNVLSIDLAPTFLELAGIALPPNLHGRSLVPLFSGSAPGWRTSFLTEYFHEPQYPLIASWQAIRTDRWKLIHYTGTDGKDDELYDLKTDPHELTNRIADPAAAEVLRTLRAELRQALETSR